MTNVQTRPQILEERTLNFAYDTVEFCRQLPKTVENKVNCTQLIGSVSSIGANYAEANNASSRQDFRNKIFIAKKESAEARYWLKLAAKVNPDSRVDPLLSKVSQLIFIFQKIVSTLANGK